MTGDHFPRATFYPSVSANRRNALNLKASTIDKFFSRADSTRTPLNKSLGLTHNSHQLPMVSLLVRPVGERHAGS
jgi:hypothetical protein